MDENEFFRQVTLRICSNLDIAEGLRSSIEYISKYIPADAIYLERNDVNLQSMHVIAKATPEKGEIMDLLIPFDKEAMKKMDDISADFRIGNLPPVLVINNPKEEPVTRCMLNSLNAPICSAMSLPLIIKGKPVGALAVIARGENRYDENHARLYQTIKEPFYVAMSNAMEHREVIKLKEMLSDDYKYLQSELRRISGENIIGSNFGLKDVMHKVHKVAPLDSPVLLLGETGTGKDVIANAIHQMSSRSDGPFISVNCGAIPDNLIDSELFGHEKGAFTGAISQKRGRFERADKGTIFLDEIGELPLEAQTRLLKVLQIREIERVGGTKTIQLDIRIIAATNRNLQQMVNDNKFREDLWFRLNVFPINIPPLRERKSDIPALLQYFIEAKSKELKLSDIPSVKPGALADLIDYEWPGNVRELQNIVERELILNSKGPLTFGNLKGDKTKGKSILAEDNTGENTNLDIIITRHIRKILLKTHGKIHGENGAAELLGINASTLRNKMNKLGIRYGRESN